MFQARASLATAAFALLVVLAGCSRKTDTPAAQAAEAGTSVQTSHTAAPGTEPGKAMSLKEAYPDYKPGADDPEADAAARGYRDVAKRRVTLETGGAPSMDDLIQLVATGVDRGDGPLLDRTAVTFGDFETILWPEFPQSRPAAGVPIGESWDFLRRRHVASFNRTTGELHGKGLKVASIRIGKVVDYTNFKLHDDMAVTLVDKAGNPIQFDMVRTVVECGGRFKLYSTRD